MHLHRFPDFLPFLGGIPRLISGPKFSSESGQRDLGELPETETRYLHPDVPSFLQRISRSCHFSDRVFAVCYQHRLCPTSPPPGSESAPSALPASTPTPSQTASSAPTSSSTTAATTIAFSSGYLGKCIKSCTQNQISRKI